MTLPDPHRRSVSFSIAFVRVCEWVNNPINHYRPTPEILAQARIHAEQLGDHFILEQIEEIEAANFVRDTMPTPKLPPPGEAAPMTIKTFKRKGTRPFDYGVKVRETIVILPPPPGPEEIAHVDALLDEFLRTFD